MPMMDCVDDYAPAPARIEFNETNVGEEIELTAEELEEAIAPIVPLPHILANHNETFVAEDVELGAEELEEVIAPYVVANHNEAIVSDEVELSAEGLDEVIAPSVASGDDCICANRIRPAGDRAHFASQAETGFAAGTVDDLKFK